ncbi:MAG: Gfo/Idh/MocA family oxidoreductase [Nitriliruptoraceae bacterium]
MDPVRVASVGVGEWADSLAAKAAASGLELAGCYARSADAREDFAARYGGRAFDDWDALLASDDIDGVLIVTPHSTHAQLAIEAADAGKHVFLEKPMTMRVTDGKRVIAACQAAGVVLAVGHKFRYEPVVQRMKAMVDDGSFGIVHLAEATRANPGAIEDPPGWSYAAAENPGGGIGRSGIHAIDALAYLLGPARRVAAFSKRLANVVDTDADEVTTATIEFASGPVANFSTATVVPRIAHLRVHGTQCAALAELDGPRLLVQDIDARQMQPIDIDPVDAVAAELADFARCVRTGETPVSDGDAALESVVIWEGLVESARSGSVVDLDEVRAQT